MKIDLSPQLQEAMKLLVEHLLASKVFTQYRNARSNMDSDREAHALMDQLGKSQARVRQMQAQGEVNQAEIDSLRLLQQRVLRNPVIVDYLGSRQEAANLLREINREISELLGLNFASFANHPTC
ncbi:MAG TPA: YlbF family regulator [Anaerolineales bacterium]|nr:YlbF family regulator [Anaerolineales bacterium]